MYRFKKRKDIIEYILDNSDTDTNEIFDSIMNNKDPSKKGFIFETLIESLIVCKCIEGIDYDTIKVGTYPCLKDLEDFKHILNKNINSKQGGVSDITIIKDGILIPFSIKYKKHFLPSASDVSIIDNTFKSENYKIGLIVKDKKLVINHNYTNKKSIHKILHDKVITDNLLFDEQDIIKGIKVFCCRFGKYETVKSLSEDINKDYLLSRKKQLVLKLHQKMTLLMFIHNLKNNEYKHIIGDKPRSGKSISILLMAKYLLENNYGKILIMTAIPDTIIDFITSLDSYIDFKDIKYKIQKEDDFNTIENDFIGIVFSSIQYFKKDNNAKIKLLKKLNFDVIFNDECHLGGSTLKTQKNIIEIQDDTILDGIKINIFASGTSNKTQKYYKIKPSCVYEWTIEDEAYMKQISYDKDIENILISRHGSYFKECINDISLNKNYSNCPIQVLVKSLIPQNIINDINAYNIKHNTKYGFSFTSLLALKQVNNKNKYVNEFELCCSSDGQEMLINVLDTIISNDKNKLTVIKHCEKIQNKYNSRISTNQHPLLIIIYLPTNTRNNTIDCLQKTLKNFLHKHKLWPDYNIEYTNSKDNTGDIKQSYNDFIANIMEKTKKDKKKGCVLLLGNKGGTGITYHLCDITISLDDGHSIDNQKQKYSRCLTEGEGKTIGINVDMNIQRTHLVLLYEINNFRKITKKNMSNDEILYYLYTHNIFLFDPLHYNNNNFKDIEIKSYYKKEVQNIMNEIDDTMLLENIECVEDYLKDIIKTEFKNSINKINPDFEGEQKDCPKPTITPVEVDSSEKEVGTISEKTETGEEIDLQINRTFEMCKFLFPLLCLLSISYNIISFKDIFDNDICKNIILKICQEKKIDLNLNNYNKTKIIMNHIIDTNDSIVNSIREIYRIATPNNLRSLIEKHFIPSKDEKKNNAEIPTPVKLVDDMLSKMPSEYWNEIHTTFEPCCGKGNFVLGIFDMFFKGLETKIPDKVKRCKIIMKECIYYADLTTLNVFITTEILKCHIEDKCGVKVDYEFNCNVGDTLSLDIEDKWNLKGFDAVIGNPPYQQKVGQKKTETLWDKFIIKSFEILKPMGYLVYVHPSGWRNINGKFKNIQKKILTRDLQYLEIHNEKDGIFTFNSETRYDWYVLKNNKVDNTNTIIKFQDGTTNKVNVHGLEFIPNGEYDKIMSIIAKNREENVNVIHDFSLYETRKSWMSRIKTKDYKYPCVYTVNSKSEITYYYSSKQHGHYNIPKFIWSNGRISSIGSYVDINGDYGLTQFSYAIVDKPENLQKIKKAFDCKEFRNLMEMCAVGQLTVNYKVISKFKKDFWKEFIDKDENTIQNEDYVSESEEINTECKLKINNDKYTCECGSIINKTGKTKHEKSLKHKKFIQSK